MEEKKPNITNINLLVQLINTERNHSLEDENGSVERPLGVVKKLHINVPPNKGKPSIQTLISATFQLNQNSFKNLSFF